MFRRAPDLRPSGSETFFLWGPRPAWRKRPKRRVIQAPKFYFADVGMVNRLARRGRLERGSEAFGHAFENWVHHELSAFVSYRGYDGELCHWRLAGGTEVDFVLGDMNLAVEAKASRHIGRQPRTPVAHDRRRCRGAAARGLRPPVVERRTLLIRERAGGRGAR